MCRLSYHILCEDSRIKWEILAEFCSVVAGIQKFFWGLFLLAHSVD